MTVSNSARNLRCINVGARRQRPVPYFRAASRLPAAAGEIRGAIR